MMNVGQAMALGQMADALQPRCSGRLIQSGLLSPLSHFLQRYVAGDSIIHQTGHLETADELRLGSMHVASQCFRFWTLTGPIANMCDLRLLTDAVEKVPSTRPGRNDRINIGIVLNRCCVIGSPLESMLFGKV